MRIAFILVALILVGCDERNKIYCPGLPGDNCQNGGGQQCDSNDDCASEPDAPICKTAEGAGVCVQCLDDTQCTGDTPQCGGDNRCFGCRVDDDCPSKACLEEGVCAAESSVVYASTTGVDVAGCGVKAGQNECSLTQAMMEANAPRNIIRLAPGAYQTSNGLSIAKEVSIIARSSTFKRTSPGAVITVEDSQTLKLVGGTIQNTNNNQGIECRTEGSLQIHEVIIEDMPTNRKGIETTSCALTVSRSKIQRNLGGGISMLNNAAKVVIKNSFITLNGVNNTTDVGGMRLRATNDSVVEFNTVSQNTAKLDDNFAGGINCEVGMVNVRYNLVYRNPAGADRHKEVGGMCNSQQSFVMPGELGDNDVLFKNPDPAAPDYHLTAGSPNSVHNVDNVTDCPSVDIDGDQRPAEGKCDLGADEYRPGQ